MARRQLDTTGNEVNSTLVGKINDNFIDLYAAGGAGGAVTGTTGTFSAGVSGTTGTFSGAVAGTTGTFSAAVAGTTGTFSGAVAGTTGTFTGLGTVNSLKIDTGTKTATATSGAATLAKFAGVITSEGLTTAAAASYSLVITTTALGVAATDQAYASVANGTNSQGIPLVSTVTCGTNTVTVVVNNQHATEALNGTLKISYFVVKN